MILQWQQTSIHLLKSRIAHDVVPASWYLNISTTIIYCFQHTTLQPLLILMLLSCVSCYMCWRILSLLCLNQCWRCTVIECKRSTSAQHQQTHRAKLTEYRMSALYEVVRDVIVHCECLRERSCWCSMFAAITNQHSCTLTINHWPRLMNHLHTLLLYLLSMMVLHR
jgi:hypothetical protein